MKNLIAGFIARHGKLKVALYLLIVVLVLSAMLHFGVDEIVLND